ncbi:MAG: DUF4019 domain-containing protein [Bacteroidia bacterium]|nr:DUF4019 domain-containing protein [Bacteroidia bacterium]
MKTAVFFLLCTILSGCTCSRMNDTSDKMGVEKIADEFYSNLQFKNYKNIYPSFSNSFWKVMDTTKFRQSLEESTEKLGALLEYNLVDWQTYVLLGSTKTVGDYTLVYKNKYEKLETTETLTLKYEDDGQIRIVGYNVLLDQLNINAR